MGFTNRWVCRSLVKYDFDEKWELLENDGMGSYKNSGFDLDYIVDLKPDLIATAKSRYLLGDLYFEDIVSINKLDIGNEGRISLVGKNVKTAHKVSFVLSDKGDFLFDKSGSAVRDGQKVLSRILFKKDDKIKHVFYDIERIEEDVNKGVFQGMWTTSFRGRDGNIKRGIVYGNDIVNDVMYDQTSGAPKNFIGVVKGLEENMIKIKITRSGSINILKPLDVSKSPSLYNIIEEFSKYREDKIIKK